MVVLQEKQIAELVNTATKNVLGGEDLITEDLQGVVDCGTSLANADAYSNFLYELSVTIRTKIFVDRAYSSTAPNIIKTSNEYGQLIQKTRAALDDAMDNQSYQLVNGASYDDNVYYGGIVSTKIFMKRITWEIRKSIADEQIKNAFTSAQELGSFVSMIFTMIQNSIQVKTDSVIMATIDNFIAETLNNEKATTKVNLLAKYKEIYADSTLTAKTCIYDKEFLKYASSEIKKYMGLMAKYGVLFNLTGTETFTPKDKQHVVILDSVASKFATYLESDTFHNDLVKLPYYETVSAWQGLGQSASFEDVSKIKVTTANGETVEKDGIIAVLFDDSACGVNHIENKTRSKYTNSGEFVNYWFKQNMGYFNDFDENFIVFYVSDAE